MKNKLLIILIILIFVTVVYAADRKWSVFPANTTVADADEMLLIDIGTGDSERITVLNLFDTIDTSAELIAILTDESGTGALLFAISPTLVTPALGVIASGVGTTLTALNGDNIQPDTIDDDSIDWADCTFADFDFETAWRMWHSDAAGDVTEIILGANGTFLESNGAAAAPAFRVLADGDVPDNITIDLATLATTVTVSDDEATNDDQEVVFTTDNVNLESDGDFHYSPDTGTVTATVFVENGNAVISEAVATAAIIFGDATPDADGEMAFDTTGDGATVTAGVIDVHDGTEIVHYFGSAGYPGADNHILKYDAGTNKVVWEVDAGGGGGNDVYVEEGDAARVDSSGADLYIDFDDTDFGVGVVGNEGNVTITDDGHAHTGASVTGIADAQVDNNITIDLATLATTVTVTDDEATNDDQEIVFTTDNTNLESDGDFHYSPDTGTVTATQFVGGGAGITGTLTAYNSIADPGASGSISFDDGETATYTGANDGAISFFTIQNSDGDHTGGNMYLLDLDYSADDGDVDADFIKFQDSGSVVMTIQQNGDIATDGGLVAGGAITEAGNAVPNATDHLGFFGGTTSAQLLAEISNETGTGLSVFATAPVFTTSVQLTGADANPAAAAGTIAYDNVIAVMSGGGIRWYDNDSVRLLVDLETDPSNDDYVVTYDAAADGFYMSAAGTGNMNTATYDAGVSGGVDQITTVDSTYASDYVVLTGTAVGTDAPKTDGALTYDATTGTLSATQFVGGGIGGATAWDDIADPDASATIDFVTYTETIDIGVTDTGGPKSGLILDVTGLGAGVTAVTALEITTATDDDTDYTPIAIYDDSGVGNDLLFQISSQGEVYTNQYYEMLWGQYMSGATNSQITFNENSDEIQFYFGGTDLDIVWTDGALNLRNNEDGVDAIVEIEGKDNGEKGILRVMSDGDDNYIELHHDDTDGHIITDTGDIHIEPAGGDTVFTGNGDFGGADLELPQASPAVPGVDGGVEVDFTDGKVVLQHGAAHAELGGSVDVVVGTLIKSWAGTIYEPDGVNDVLTVKAINSIEFPHGVVITAVYLGVSSDAGYVLTVQNFDDFDTINGAQPTIDTVTYPADTTGEIIDSTPTFATIAAGQIIMISIPATDVDWIHFEIYYYEPAA